MRKPVYIALGYLSLLLGIIGAFLPIMPTTPFLVVAAYFFKTGSPKMHQWLLDLPRVGPALREWEEHKVIRPHIKLLATVILIGSVGSVIALRDLPGILGVMAALTAAAVIILIWAQKSRSDL